MAGAAGRRSAGWSRRSTWPASAAARWRPRLDLLAPHLAGGDVVVLLGPASAVGHAATRRRDDLALAALAPWRELVPPRTSWSSWSPTGCRASGGELGSRHLRPRRPDGRGGPAGRARDGAHQRRPLRRPARRADRRRPRRRPPAGRPRPAPPRPWQRRGLPQVRQADAEVAEEICRLAGLAADTEREAGRLLAGTRTVADRCALDPRADLGLGEVHFPELDADAARRSRRRTGRGRRPTGCSGSAARPGSAGATARLPGSGSGSGSTTSWR